MFWKFRGGGQMPLPWLRACMQGSVWELYSSLSICLNLFKFRVGACFAFGKTLINQCTVEKTTFEDQSEENQCLQNKCYACCYILLSGTRPKCRCTSICDAAMLLQVQLVPKPHCYLLRTALNSPHPIHSADGDYTRNCELHNIFMVTRTTITKCQ